MNIYTKFGALTVSLALLASCSTLGSMNPFQGNGDDDEEADKAGRIAMVSADSVLQPDPDLVATAIVLPDARVVDGWPQAGRVSNKAPGHVIAGQNFDVDWRWGGASGTDKNRALSVPPIAANGAIYVFDAEQTIYAVDATTGKTRWKKELSSGNDRDRRAFGGGMAIEGDKLIVASGFGFVAALDASNGSEIWKRVTEAPMTGSPAINDGRVFIVSNNNEFTVLSLDDGTIEWTDQAIAESARVLSSPSPAAIDEIVVAPYSSGEVIAYLPSNGRRLWTDSLTRAGRFTPISAINDIASRPVLAAGLVFASSQSGVLAAIDGRSGNRIWALPFGTTQAPFISGEFLFAVGVDGQLICVEAVSGKVVWVQQLQNFENMEKKKNRISYAGPILASNKLVTVSSDGRLSAYSPQTGELLQEEQLVRTGRFGADAGFFIEPIAYDGRLILLADNGTLFSVR
ncbi:MAG: hypothetical protein CMK07_15210 [Ponticaulis sp.]|nr:hypothetical protein [Ponticaulis sp.]